MRYFQPWGITDPDAPYINGDPTIGRRGSIPPAEAFEHPQRELVNLIEGAKLTANETDLYQVLSAVRSQRMNYAVALNVAAGQQNALVVEFDPPIGNTMTPGMPLRVKPVQDNTLPTTLRVDGVEYPLRRADGSECEADDIKTAVPFECLWNDSGYWALTNYRGFGGPPGSSNTYITKIPYTVDIGAVNALVADFVPAIPAFVPGDAIEVKLANDITGATTIAVNGQPAVAVVRANGSPLQEGDGAAGQIALLLRTDGGVFQFSGIIPQSFTGMGVPVGSLILTLGNAAPLGTLKLNGALLVRAEHPRLWTFANASGRIVDETDWQNGASHYWTAFSRGDGVTNFRLPELRGEFPRFYDDNRGIDPARILGRQQADAVGQLTMAGIVNLNNPKVWMENADPAPDRSFTQYVKDHFIEDAELAWARNKADSLASISTPWEYNRTFEDDIAWNAGGANSREITWVSPARSQGGVAWPPGIGGVTAGPPNGGHRNSRITSEITLTGTGGSAETRGRNTALMPCIVDG